MPTENEKTENLIDVGEADQQETEINLDDNSKEAFDSIINTGSIEAIQIPVSGLKAKYEQENGYEGKMYTGKAATNANDVFRSQAELVAAMNDKRYDRDPAYRQDVIEKLDRSDLEF